MLEHVDLSKQSRALKIKEIKVDNLQVEVALTTSGKVKSNANELHTKCV